MIDLNLANTTVNDDQLHEIVKNNTGLRHLDLTACRWITQKGITSICHYCKNLVSLTLSECAQLHGINFREICKSLPQITKIGIGYWPHLYSMDLFELTRLKSLEYLDLSGCMHVHYLSEILNSVSPTCLNSVILADIPSLDDNTLLAVFRSCPLVTTLNINHSGIISKHVLMDIPQIFPNMKHLFLAGHQSVDDFVVENIARYCLPLVTLDVSYTGFMGHFLVKLGGHQNLENLFMSGCLNVPNSDMVEQIRDCCPNLVNLQALNIWSQTEEETKVEELEGEEEIEVQ